MKREPLTKEQALELGMTLPFALIRQMSRVTLGPTPDAAPDMDALLEARFFDARKEVRLFRCDGHWKGVCLTCEPQDECIEVRHAIENAQCLGSEVSVRYLINYDEDGQCFIKTFCLSGWKGGACNDE